MNCPECGNKLTKQIDQRTKKETGYWFCEEHRDLYTQKEVNDFYFYNRRLKKVLSKFVKKSLEGKRYYYNWVEMDLQINYFVDEQKFEIMGKIADVNLDNDFITSGTFKGENIDNWIRYKECEISLETVESLLNDLEVK